MKMRILGSSNLCRKLFLIVHQWPDQRLFFIVSSTEDDWLAIFNSAVWVTLYLCIMALWCLFESSSAVLGCLGLVPAARILHGGQARPLRSSLIRPSVHQMLPPVGARYDLCGSLVWPLCMQPGVSCMAACKQSATVTAESVTKSESLARQKNRSFYMCGEPAISHDSHHVSLVQWTNLFVSRHKGHSFKSPGGTCVKLGFSC